MAAYSPTPADVEGAENQDQTLVLVQTQSWLNRTLKIFGGLFLLTLGLAVVFVVVWTWSTRAGTAAAPTRPGQIEALLQATEHKTADTHSTLRKISSKAKAAIHLEGSYEEGVDSGLQWNSEQGQGFSQGGIKLQNNQITIPESGLYFVYSQASFRVSCLSHNHDNQPQNTYPGPDDEGRQRTPLSHRVWRFSESIGNEVSLMSAVRSACSGQEQQQEGGESSQGWYNAIYLGAVFQLHRGDRLWTETNQLSEMETDDGKTFFGVFALF